MFWLLGIGFIFSLISAIYLTLLIYGYDAVKKINNPWNMNQIYYYFYERIMALENNKKEKREIMALLYGSIIIFLFLIILHTDLEKIQTTVELFCVLYLFVWWPAIGKFHHCIEEKNRRF